MLFRSSEDIAYDLKVDTLRVQEIVGFCLEQGLFSQDETTGHILCLKMYKFLDDATRKSASVVNMLNSFAKLKNSDLVGQIPSKSEKVRPDIDLELDLELDKDLKKEYISSEEDKSKPEVSTPCPHEKIRELYNSLLPELVTCTNRNKVFDKHTKSRWNESKDRQDMTWWQNFFKSVRDSDFLMGRTDKPFTCSLDWLVKPSNFTKVLNGNYINRNNTQKGSIEKWAL